MKELIAMIQTNAIAEALEKHLTEQGKLKSPFTVITGGGKDVGDSVDDLLQKIPEDHIVHEIPGNISENMKYLLFTLEKHDSGWIKRTFLGTKKKIRFYGNTIKIGETIIEQWIMPGISNMPSASFMPGNTFDEKRENLNLLLKTFDPPEEKKN